MSTRYAKGGPGLMKLALSLTLLGLLLVGRTALSSEVSRLANMDVTPVEVTLNVGEQQLFTAKGYDAQGNEIPITPGWAAVGGTITAGGLYTSPIWGDFTVTASVQGSTVTGTATVHVNPPELTRIDVTPPEVTLNVNEQQQFQAKGYDAQGNEVPITPGWSAVGGTITAGGLYTSPIWGDFTVTASVQGSTVTGTATIHVNPPALPMQTYEHPSLGTLCYPLGWTVASVDPDHIFFTDPTGQLLAGYRLWDSAMGSSPEAFISNYFAQKPEGTELDEVMVATLCTLRALSTTLRYFWGIVEIITVATLEDRPAKLFVEGPLAMVADFVAAGFYAIMGGCCQFP